jgi:hypothetical protein
MRDNNMIHSIIKLIANYNQTSFGALGLFFIFLGIAMVLIGPLGIYSGIRMAVKFFTQTKNWPVAQGVITVSQMGSKFDPTPSSTVRARTLYSSAILFKFNVDGTEYESDKITWGEFSTSDKRMIEKKLAEYPLGKKIAVHYNPENPSDCIVNLHYNILMAIPWIGGIVFIIGGGGFAWGMLYFYIKQLAEKGLWP